MIGNILKKKTLEKILHPSEYASTDYLIPYIISLSHKNTFFEYIGLEHSTNPSDKQFIMVEERMGGLLDFHGNTNLYIGSESQLPKLTTGVKREDAIRLYGEAGLAAYYAHTFEATTFDLSISQTSLLSKVAKLNTDARDIAAWLLINILWGFTSHHRRIRHNDIELIKNTLRQSMSILEIDESIEKIYRHTRNITMQSIHLPEKIEDLGKAIIYKEALKNLQSPYREDSPLNKVGEMFNHLWDREMLEILLQHIEEKKNLIVFAGHNHVFAQRPALEYFYKILNKKKG